MLTRMSPNSNQILPVPILLVLPWPYLLNLVTACILLCSFNMINTDMWSIIHISLTVFSMAILWRSNPGYIIIQQNEHVVTSLVEDGSLLLTDNKQNQYCEKCDIVQPFRAYHCKKCNVCVTLLDHHCDFIQTCIGERNHCRFYITILLHCSLTFKYWILLLSMSLEQGNSYTSIGLYSLWLCSLFYFTILVFLLISLLCFHTYLVLTGSTSYELLRSQQSNLYLSLDIGDYSYSQGYCTNILSFIMRDECVTTTRCMQWTPTVWKRPIQFRRESTTVYDNPCNNQFYSCC